MSIGDGLDGKQRWWDDLRGQFRRLTPEQIEEIETKRSDREAARISELERETRRRSLLDSGVRLDGNIIDRVLDGDLAETPAMTRVRRWLSESGPYSTLVLVGGTGVGKTVAAAAALVGTHGKCVNADKLSRLSASNYGPDQERFEEMLNTASLLVVDDVGTERDADSARHMMREVVDTRQCCGRTLMTTNLTAEQLKSRMCDRTLSRLYGCGALYGVDGDDMRRAKS